MYAIPPVQNLQPDQIILHIGTNDISYTSDSNKIANDIFALATLLETEKAKVTISGLIYRSDKSLNERISQVNSILFNLSCKHKMKFIKNDNIDQEKHLNNGGLHLNRCGDSKFATNLISELKHLYLQESIGCRTCSFNQENNIVRYQNNTLCNENMGDDIDVNLKIKDIRQKM